jgi:hypothetical protein
MKIVATLHIYFKTSPKIYWGGKLVDYEEKYAVFTPKNCLHGTPA